MHSALSIKRITVTVEIYKDSLVALQKKKGFAEKNARLLESNKISLVKSALQKNRYYYDKNTVNFAELIGGYVDKDYFIPVSFGVKLSNTNGNSLYIMIGGEKIKKAKVIKSVGSETPGAADSRLATLSIPQILSNVNTTDIIRYIPDGFLNEEKRKIKYKAISDTIVYTNKKNDAKYKQYIESGNMATAQAMVEQAAREKGYDKGFYNIIVTQYEPDSLKQYLNNNTVIYNKKTMNGKYQVDSGRIVASAHDMPFIANTIIPKNTDVSTENNKKIKASPAVTKLNGLKMAGNTSNIIIPENSDLSTENDKKYLEAVKNGDMATA